jgi:histidinol-phosphate/aromatic aminotransferase/cobyric acid decarboxylase-like protein
MARSRTDKDTTSRERRKLIANVREETFSFLEKHNFSYVKSVSNCFMIDVKRKPQDVIKGMFDQKVIIGRTWPVWPTHVRVSVGSHEEMQKFQTAFLKVMA